MPPTIGILNAGSGAWVFEPLAEHLSCVLGVPVADTPVARMYVLGWDEERPLPDDASFIPLDAVRAAADKRLQAEAFQRCSVRTPRTLLLSSVEELRSHVRRHPDVEWVLKWPIGCGGSGHRLVTEGTPIPPDWPRPFVLQQFVRSETPEVYRLYGIAGEVFGWNVRCFPAEVATSPWVAHARGARYADPGSAPSEAVEQAQAALAATGLATSFGCVDLLRAPDGGWLVLEVGTDGIYQQVDRDVDLPGFNDELDARLARAFLAWACIKQA